MASDQTYLQLVNSAIRESGAVRDPLTSSTFTSTNLDPLASRFKSWVAQAYEELQQERMWEFMTKRATLLVKPRLFIRNVQNVLFTGNIGLVGQESEARTTNAGISDLILVEGSTAALTAKSYYEYTTVDGYGSTYKLNELLDIYNPVTAASPATTGAYRVIGTGRYDLGVEVSDLLEADLSRMYIQSTGAATDYSGALITASNTGGSDMYPLIQVPWDIYAMNYEWQGLQFHGRPTHFASAPDGSLSLYPQPDRQYVLHFDYLCEPSSLTDYDDVVTNIPAQYQDAIMWRAVMYYADYDRKNEVYMRALKRYRFYKKRMETHLLPAMSFVGKATYGV